MLRLIEVKPSKRAPIVYGFGSFPATIG